MLETMHETWNGDPSAWHRPEALAEAFGVSVRTIRAMAKRGELERQRVPGGRVYYRRTAAEVDEGQPEADAPEAGALVDWLKTEITHARQAHAEDVADLRDRLAAAAVAIERQRAEAAEARLLADVAARDAERAQDAAEAIRAQLSTERLRRRAAERYAATSWWQVKRRRELRAVLEDDQVRIGGAA